MNPRYKQTYSQHRVLFSLPLILAAVISVWAVIGAPKSYESATSLWVDTPPPGVSSLDNTNIAILTPAEQAQQLLGELLTTRSFRLAVGKEGPLEKYLATHSSSGFGPTAFLSALRGKSSLDYRVFSALGQKNVLTTVAGPQVLGITLRGPAPSVAVGTLKALVDQFNIERRNFDVSREQSSMSYFENQVKAASAGLATAERNLAGATTPGSSADLHQLTQAARVAKGRLTAATRAYNRAALNLAASRGEQEIFKVIDPISSAKAVTKKKKTVFALVAGLFVGALISFLGIVFASGRRRESEGTSNSRADGTWIPEPVAATANGAPLHDTPVVEHEGG